MVHKIAKLILEHADSFLERAEAIDVALSLGMTLDEIQEYLDWVDSVHGGKANQSSKPPAEQVQQENSAPSDCRLPMEDGEGELRETKGMAPHGHETRQAEDSD